MLNNELLQELSARISALVPQAQAAGRDLEKAVHDILQQGFSKLNLVTREEFEAAREMAANARAENERLAARIEALEAALGARAGETAP